MEKVQAGNQEAIVSNHTIWDSGHQISPMAAAISFWTQEVRIAGYAVDDLVTSHLSALRATVRITMGGKIER